MSHYGFVTACSLLANSTRYNNIAGKNYLLKRILVGNKVA
jgi:hypothetical protein